MEGQVNAVTPLLGDAPNPQPRPDAHACGPAACTHRISRLTLGVSNAIGEEIQGKKPLRACVPRACHVSATHRASGRKHGRSPPGVSCLAWPVARPRHPPPRPHLARLPPLSLPRVVSALRTGTPVLRPRGAPGLQVEVMSEPRQEAWGGPAFFSQDASDVVVTAFPQPRPPSEPLLPVVTALGDACARVCAGQLAPCARVPSAEPEPVGLRMALWSASVPQRVRGCHHAGCGRQGQAGSALLVPGDSHRDLGSGRAPQGGRVLGGAARPAGCSAAAGRGPEPQS